jgi:hypothetical protein
MSRRRDWEEAQSVAKRLMPLMNRGGMTTLGRRHLECWGMLSLIIVLAIAAGPTDAAGQKYVRLDGTVDWVSGNTLMLRVDPATVAPVYVIIEGSVVPAAPPVTTIRVDVSRLRQSEYSFMQPSERVSVTGVFDDDRQVLVATSLIRGQAP